MLYEYIITHSVAINENEPWWSVANLESLLVSIMAELGDDYEIQDGIAIHRTAKIGHNVTIKSPAIIGPDCFNWF